MNVADPSLYLSDFVGEMQKTWPQNRTLRIACHGHSVPAGYFATPYVNSRDAYPHRLFLELKSRFPCAVLNVIVTAIGGEHSVDGAERFDQDVLALRPDVVTIDYALNDRAIGLGAAKEAWSSMIRRATDAGARVLLLTPTFDLTQLPGSLPEEAEPLRQHAEQIRGLARDFGVGLVDSFAAFEKYTGDLSDLLSWCNHPNERGHDLVVRELLRWFPFTLPK
jgi:acyl-CoA thioesterase-1